MASSEVWRLMRVSAREAGSTPGRPPGEGVLQGVTSGAEAFARHCLSAGTIQSTGGRGGLLKSGCRVDLGGCANWGGAIFAMLPCANFCQ